MRQQIIIIRIQPYSRLDNRFPISEKAKSLRNVLDTAKVSCCDGSPVKPHVTGDVGARLKTHYPGAERTNSGAASQSRGRECDRKHQYEKAEAIFYKAYLYDPADPFTLNNLGYISELQGELDRAQKFYKLASEQGSDALIDVSNSQRLEGKPMSYALNSIKDVPMRVNRMNVEAIELLSQGRNFDADDLLRQALALSP